MNLLDHRILIWDFDDYINSKIDAYLISDFFDFLFKSLKSNAISISIHELVLNEILKENSLPFGKIHTSYPELIDINELFLSQYSRLSEHIDYITFSDQNNLTVKPNTLISNCTNNLFDGVKNSFQYILSVDDIHTFITIEEISNFDNIEISNITSSKKIPVFKERTSILEILDGLGRTFEMNDKHDPVRPHPNNKGKSVARLTADEKYAQELLIFAKGIPSDSEKLYNYDYKNQVYVTFLLHNSEVKKYHGHDVDDIPQQAKNMLVK